MLLQGKVAVIHGGGGAIGGAVARVFAREGARVYLCGRTRAKLDRVVHDIVAAGGRAEATEVDALDEHAIEHHVEGVALRAGRIDIALNAVGFAHVQGTPFVDLPLADFAYPIEAYTRTNFLTAQAAARRMRFLDALDQAWRAERVERRDDEVPFHGGWLLYLGYELAAEIEPTLCLPAPREAALPTALALRCPAAIVVDHERACAFLSRAQR